MKMRNRIILIFVVLIGLSVSVLGAFGHFLIEKIYINALDERLEKEAQWIETLVQIERDSGHLEQIVNQSGKELGVRMTLIDLTGKVLADSEYDKDHMENHRDRPEVIAALSGNTGREIRYSDTLGIEMLYVAIPQIQNNEIKGIVRLAIPLQQIKDSLKLFWYSLLLGLAIIFVITLFISYRVSNKMTSPIEHMTQIAKKITNYDYSARLEMERNDEIGQLGKAINLMAESLEKQMETIFENEKKLKSVLDHMASGVLLVDKKGNIVLANPALEDLLGEKIDQIIGKHHSDVGQQKTVSELIQQSLFTGVSFHTEIGIYEPSKKYLNTNIIPIVDSDGKINGVLAVLHDITQIKHLENMRTEFVASVSHELRTPITAVKGFAETLLDGEMDDEETCRSFLTIIYNESDRLHRLINDLLDLSKIELNKDILKISRVNLKALIESTVDTMIPQAEKRRIAVQLKLDSVRAELDEDRLRQVIINLLTNAIAYTPENGIITVRLYEKPSNLIRIEVEDTGIGIPKKSLPRIFERFYRVDKARSRESGGTGLGLAIAKHIVETHGGIIQVESEVNKGTKFMIDLPKYQIRDQ